MLTVPKSILLEIGRAAVLRAHVDRNLAVIYMNLAGLDESTGNAKTHRVGFSKLADMVEKSLPKRFKPDDPFLAEFMSAIATARTLAEERNDIVHSRWSFGPNFDMDKATSLKVQKRGTSALLEIKARTLPELEQLTGRLQGLVDLLTYLQPKAR
jgi:hypothetical protein